VENDSATILVPPAANKAGRSGTVLQIAALVFAVPAVALGVFVVWTTAFPPICGDSSGVVALGVVGSWIVDLTIGLLVLAVGVFVKNGSARLRNICVATSLVTLSLPIIASMIFQTTRCH
jgi:hypothetical protein